VAKVYNQKTMRRLLEDNGWKVTRGGKREAQRQDGQAWRAEADHAAGTQAPRLRAWAGSVDIEAGWPIMRHPMGDAKQVELAVTVHEEDGMYWAEVPSHPGLFASGETMDELIEALGEAWIMYTHDENTSRPAVHPATQSLSVLVPA
jgi:predicted RNase H-like HicB family nuclease